MASFSDDFNRANSSDLGAGWLEVSGDWSITSNQLSPGVDTGTVILRAAGAMDSSDHSAQVTIAATAAASMGVWCRGNSNISTGYLWRNDGSTWDLFSVVSSTFTLIGTYAAPAGPGDVAKVQAVGSTIKAYVNGVERVSVTNTAVTSGTGVGIRSGTASGIRYDDFAAADVTTGAALGTASSTESAQPLAGAKQAPLGIAGETSTAQPLTGAKAAVLTPATELEAAQALAGTKTAALAPATAVEAAQPLTGTVTAVLGTAAVVEAALALTGSKTVALAPAVEVDTARPLTVRSATTRSPERTYRIPAEHRTLRVGR
ncbi:hypothetical protein C9F11_37245 [Streptomyces sp. YIM 121038]|uniref:hypothetical protein n=1 Tax=Streptomyces sp. YIM 121038 TaxID=2136401 RepID=UPI0011622FC4|nr:hypothetical protein [Streptomyces sp. YIM 121038]QCX81032.1 hypothetical protein C9F11_37245 [Streptomyces sp. YIM 121038]